MRPLCVLLSGSAAEHGHSGQPATCALDMMGVIAFKGDWCSFTNAEPHAGCTDAMRFSAALAAGSVSIK